VDPKSNHKLSLPERLTLGISSCLHGAEVRYDGGHKRDELLLGTFGRYARWVLVCPEAELGLGVPRPIVRLEGSRTEPRLVQIDSRRDITDDMRAWARVRVGRLAADDLDGFILKKNSPSCGLFGVKVFDDAGVQSGVSRGIFADELVKAFPLLPVEEEGRLHDPAICENFIETVFAYHRLKKTVR
jgi:uncharacterized protein YbbK (DUF523 family)